jgi:hypothetical protein
MRRGERERESYDSDVATSVNYGVASSSRQFNSTCNSTLKHTS